MDITEPSHRSNDITYFTFRADIHPHLVDTRAPNSIHLFEFVCVCLTHFPLLQRFFPSATPFQTIIHLLLLILSTLPWVKCLTMIYRLCRYLKYGNYFRLDVIVYPHQVLQTYLELCNLRPLLLRHRQWLRLRHQKLIWSAILLPSAVLILCLSNFLTTSKVSTIFLALILFCWLSVAEDSETLRSKILDLYSLSLLQIFCAIVQLRYVGTEPYDSN